MTEEETPTVWLAFRTPGGRFCGDSFRPTERADVRRRVRVGVGLAVAGASLACAAESV